MIFYPLLGVQNLCAAWFVLTASEIFNHFVVIKLLFMKRSLLIMLLLFFGWQVCVVAQEKKMTKAEREAAWRAERLKKRDAELAREREQDSTAYIQAVTALRNGSWALEASNVTFANGVTRFVTSTTNFVSINDGQATVQTAFNNTNINTPNGIGGITLQGDVGGERMGQDEDGNIFYSFSVQGNNISATVYVTLSAGSNEAAARVEPNYSGQQMTMSGYIYPYNDSGIFMGNPSYY